MLLNKVLLASGLVIVFLSGGLAGIEASADRWTGAALVAAITVVTGIGILRLAEAFYSNGKTDRIKEEIAARAALDPAPKIISDDFHQEYRRKFVEDAQATKMAVLCNETGPLLNKRIPIELTEVEHEGRKFVFRPEPSTPGIAYFFEKLVPKAANFDNIGKATLVAADQDIVDIVRVEGDMPPEIIRRDRRFLRTEGFTYSGTRIYEEAPQPIA